MKYPNFKPGVLKDIVENPRTYAKDPYLLLTSYIISSIKEMLDPDQELWGTRFPTAILDTYIDSCYIDFQDAALQGDTIKINGQGFTIRKIGSLNIQKARKIFSFPTENEDYIIDPSGIFDVRKQTSENHQDQHESYEINRFYFWKVMWYAVGSDEEWAKLTDMEIAMYCWAIWIKKIPYSSIVNDDMVQKWWEHEYDYFEIPLQEIKSCMKEDMVDNNKTNSYFVFDYYKVQEWNKLHGQVSQAKDISDMDAMNNWHDNIGKQFIRQA